MALTKVTTKGITDNAVDGDKLAPGSVTTAKIGPSAVESSEIGNGTVTADDLASTLDLSPKTVTLAGSTVSALKRPVQDNIALLGFKMAVNDGLTVFNLVDGIVDEFHDESGTDESEGSNDTYSATGDHYQNAPINSGCISAGFAYGAITEPDTSTAGTTLHPQHYIATMGTFTVPTGMTSVGIKVWGAGGASSWDINSAYGDQNNNGGAGGFASGTLAVTGGQSLYVSSGKKGIGVSGPASRPSPGSGCHPSPADLTNPVSFGGGSRGGGGVAGVFGTNTQTPGCMPAPSVYGSGGGSAGFASPGGGHVGEGGRGGGLTASAGSCGPTQTNNHNNGNPGSSATAGGGGDQEQGGQSGICSPQSAAPIPQGSFLQGAPGAGPAYSGGGGGYYGGGAGTRGPAPGTGDHLGAGGGGSSYYGHPQITSGTTTIGTESSEASGGAPDPAYGPIPYNAGEAGNSGDPNGDSQNGNDGYVLLTGSFLSCGATTSTTLVSTAFTASSVPTSSRIVVFEENVDTPTLNTDIIASISRDGGSTYTTATLSDSGYVTGSSGQRILTGQATISGQPSGQSMRWKLALANNTVKIHGVALQWS